MTTPTPVRLAIEALEPWIKSVEQYRPDDGFLPADETLWDYPASITLGDVWKLRTAHAELLKVEEALAPKEAGNVVERATAIMFAEASNIRHVAIWEKDCRRMAEALASASLLRTPAQGDVVERVAKVIDREAFEADSQWIDGYYRDRRNKAHAIAKALAADGLLRTPAQDSAPDGDTK